MVKKTLIIIILVLFFIGIPTGAFFYVKSKINFSEITKNDDRPSIATLKTLPQKSENNITEESKMEEVITEEPTDENEIEEISENEKEVTEEIEEIATNDETNILVLNGGAEIGSAGKIQKDLEVKGYSNAIAADAQSSDHIGQMIYYKKGNENKAKEIKDIVNLNYPGIEIKEGKTAEQTSQDIVIMLGE